MQDAPEPLDVLKKLLGVEVNGASGRPGLDQEVNGHNVVENDIDEGEIDFEGLSLQDLALRNSSYAKDQNVHTSQTVEECMFLLSIAYVYMLILSIVEQEKAKFEDMHQSIRACDDVLNSVEINLTSFQNDLATVSAEIETLQARSTALSVRLENRKAVESILGPIVEEISLSPTVVRKIVEGPIDEAWVRALAEVEKKSKAIDAKSREQRNIKGINDLKPLLDNLIHKVSASHYNSMMYLFPPGS